MSEPTYMDAGNDWRRATSYLRLGTEYFVYCPEDRQCQVGMGIMIAGEPQGEKVRFSGKTKVWGVLVGGLNIRVVDGKGPCKVAWSTGTEATVHFRS